MHELGQLVQQGIHVEHIRSDKDPIDSNGIFGNNGLLLLLGWWRLLLPQSGKAIESQHFAKGKDFPEGVRALLVDKDHQPNWTPKLLSEVSDQDVMNYFKPVAWRELKFF